MSRRTIRIFWVGIVATSAVSVLGGCEKLHQDELLVFDEVSAQELSTIADAGPEDLEESTASPEDESVIGRANGSRCALNNQCDSYACVDGFCCSSECSDVCATCSAPESPGVCAPAASDPICPQPLCPSDTECLQYAAGLSNCAGIGQCGQASCSEVPSASGTPCGVGREGECDGAGACVAPNKESLGGTCQADSDCTEGHCVASASGESICCASACDGLCEQCSAAGRCDSFPESDSQCGAASCPDDSVCRDYPSSLPAGQCRGLGECSEASDCVELYSNLRPRAACNCGPDGDCELRTGESCGRASECGVGGLCSETTRGTSVCSADNCQQEGLVASRDGRDCVECEGIAIACVGDQEQRCFGGRLLRTDCINGCIEGLGCETRGTLGAECSVAQCQAEAVCLTVSAGARRCCERDCGAEGGVCSETGRCQCPPGQTFNGTQCGIESGNRCAQVDACADGVCQSDGDGAQRCCPSDCGDRVCSPDGSCRCPRGQTLSGGQCVKPQGTRCASDSECGSGSCTDGVCCSSRCDGACEQCQAVSGQCVPVSAGLPDGLCRAPLQCDGSRGGCSLPVGESCVGNLECQLGNCVPNDSFSQKICCQSSCQGQGQGRFCSNDGSRCVACTAEEHCSNGCNLATGTCRPQLATGRVCSASAQCEGGVAVCQRDLANTLRCCEFDCASQGKACTGSGRCECPAGTVSGSGASCQAAVDRTAPTARERRVTAVASAVNLVQLSFEAATDPGGTDSAIQYAVVQSTSAFSTTLTADQAIAATRRNSSPPVHLVSPFRTGARLGLLLLEHKAERLHFLVLARDPEGNAMRYNSVSVDFGQFERDGSCSSDADCITRCARFFRDADGDCFTAANNFINRCVGTGASQSVCGGRESQFDRGDRYVAAQTLNDCDDDNDQVFPGQQQFFSSPRANGTFDYDCVNGSQASSALNTLTEAQIRRLTPNGLCSDCGVVLGYLEGAACGEIPTEVRCPRGVFSAVDQALICPVERARSGPRVSCH